jgi:predicted nucleotidyltransferase
MNKPIGQSWENCDDDVKIYIESLVTQIREFLQDNLVGVYLHGSLTTASYYRPKSDIDLFIVIDRPLDIATAKALNVLIAKHSENRPTTSTFELNVITTDTAGHPVLPLPFELHYSVGWHAKILNDEMDYNVRQTDVDLVAQLMYTIQHGICLYGKPAATVFGVVAWPDFLEAVLTDYRKIVHEEDIVKMPINNVLNICRVLQLLQQKTTDVHSKDEGAAWGLDHLPAEFKPLIQRALDTYHSAQPVSVQDRKTGGIPWNKKELLAFRDYACAALEGYGISYK